MRVMLDLQRFSDVLADSYSGSFLGEGKIVEEVNNEKIFLNNFGSVCKRIARDLLSLEKSGDEETYKTND